MMARVASVSSVDKGASADLHAKYINDMVAIEQLSPEQQYHFASLARRGDQAARDVMIESNLRLVVKLARSYIKRGLTHLTILDLIEEGNLGLIKAVDKYDPEQGFRFSTYAVWWIRESIESSIMNTERTVRLPVNIEKEMRKLYRETNQMLSSIHRPPSVSEITKHVNGELGHVGELIEMSGYIEPRVTVDSLSNTSHLEAIPSQIDEEPDLSHQSQSLQANIDALINHLPKKYRDIIVHRYGLHGREVLTLHEVGVMKGLSKERVRQLQNEAIGKLQRKLDYMGWTERH
ncbi:RNA polymerase sigma factor RpoD/SigA [Vibrio maritimus]|uniref:sigma-70 family RNA polymerase sigma factor n=1 Tax=Vibrio maritimus TaxID=990268 RepID=UPI0037360C47